MVIIFWTALVSAPISPSSFMILRFLVSHKAQCWSSSDNCCMASELYSSTSEQFLKESLNIHLGLVAKTVLIALPLPVIYLSVLGLILLFLIDFFFSFPFLENCRYHLSECECPVVAVTERTRKASGCWHWGIWVPVCTAWLYVSCPSAQLKYDTTPVHLQQLCWVLQSAFGERSRAWGQVLIFSIGCYLRK